LQQKAYEARIKRLRLETQIKEGTAIPEEIGSLYSNELQILKQLQSYQQEDQDLTELIGLVQKEKELYKNLGDAIFNLYGNSPIFDDYLKALELNQNHFSYQNDQLNLRTVEVKKLKELQTRIEKGIDQRTKQLRAEKLIEEGKIPNREQREALKEINFALNNQLEIKKEAISTFSQVERLRQQQIDLYKELDTNHDKNFETSI